MNETDNTPAQEMALRDLAKRMARRRNQVAVFDDVLAERRRQDEMFGPDRNMSPHAWLSIMAEEAGEAAQATNKLVYHEYPEGDREGALDRLYTELIQSAACAIAYAEAIRKERDAERKRLAALQDEQTSPPAP